MCIYEINFNCGGKDFVLFSTETKTALNRGGTKMYYKITFMDNILFLFFFFFNTKVLVAFMNTESSKKCVTQ